MENRFFNIYKASGETSNHTLMRFRRLTKHKKSGFAGTLDPFADGVLPIAINNATKQIEGILSQPKEYCFNIKFGIQTDTGDITGEIIRKADINVSNISSQVIENILPNFTGIIKQKVPIYSAAKVNGERMCDMARRGVSLDILQQHSNAKARDVMIYEFELLKQTSHDEFALRVLCGKGTYVRQLAVDIATELGQIATVSALTRTRVGEFLIENSIKLETL